MKKFLSFFLFVLLLSVCASKAIAETNTDIDMDTVGNANVASPRAIAVIQSSQNNEIDYMLKNYSLSKLRKYVISMYNAEVRAAKQQGTELPPKLTREMLSDKQKIGEYLRSFYKYSY